MLYVYPLEAGWPPSPTQNLAPLSKLVMLYTHWQDMRRLITHIRRLSGEGKAAFQGGP